MYMKSLTVNVTKAAILKAYVLVEIRKMEAYQNRMTIGITRYHSIETVSRSKMILF